MTNNPPTHVDSALSLHEHENGIVRTERESRFSSYVRLIWADHIRDGHRHHDSNNSLYSSCDCDGLAANVGGRDLGYVHIAHGTDREVEKPFQMIYSETLARRT